MSSNWTSKAGHRMDICSCGREKQARSKRCAICARGGEATAATFNVVDVQFQPPAEQTVQTDRERKQHTSELSSLRKRYDEALRTIETMEKAAATHQALGQGLERYTIEPKFGSGTSEGTAVVLASDWHVEERVTPGSVSGLNEYNLVVAQERATRFFQSTLRLIRLLQQDTTIDTLVLALLGDFITNEIHGPENAEMNELHPTLALVEAQKHIVSGIQFLLDNSALHLVVPCHSGNHARTTIKTRFAAENGHSLEYLMYGFLASYFRHESRIEFIIPEGMHSYVNVYDQTIRFHHGHSIKYQGGVGGIYIPTNKSIAQWNKAIRADLDCFGHFHQLRDGGNFICNGSLIGYNAFALAIKADYEPPRQTLFLMDKKRGRTCLWPVIVGANRQKPLAKVA